MHCSGPNGVNLPAFLWRGHSQSGFSDSVGRMQCDRKPTMRRKRLDLSMLPTSPFERSRSTADAFACVVSAAVV